MVFSEFAQEKKYRIHSIRGRKHTCTERIGENLSRRTLGTFWHSTHTTPICKGVDGKICRNYVPKGKYLRRTLPFGAGGQGVRRSEGSNDRGVERSKEFK